jgi:hypothetical protein
MRHTFTLARALLVAIVAWSALGEASAASRIKHKTYSERSGAYWRYNGYPRPNCTFAIAEYQRRWPYHLWPPSMRCFPYPH